MFSCRLGRTSRGNLQWILRSADAASHKRRWRVFVTSASQERNSFAKSVAGADSRGRAAAALRFRHRSAGRMNLPRIHPDHPKASCKPARRRAQNQLVSGRFAVCFSLWSRARISDRLRGLRSGLSAHYENDWIHSCAICIRFAPTVIHPFPRLFSRSNGTSFPYELC